MNLEALLIEAGLSEDKVAAALKAVSDCDTEQGQIEAKAHAEFTRDAYGEDLPYISERDERISLGKNEAGEWVGFM